MIDAKELKIGDNVTHRETGLKYVIDGSIHGAVYNDGEQDFVNVKYGFNPVELFSYPLKDVKIN